MPWTAPHQPERTSLPLPARYRKHRRCGSSAWRPRSHTVARKHQSRHCRRPCSSCRPSGPWCSEPGSRRWKSRGALGIGRTQRRLGNCRRVSSACRSCPEGCVGPMVGSAHIRSCRPWPSWRQGSAHSLEEWRSWWVCTNMRSYSVLSRCRSQLLPGWGSRSSPCWSSLCTLRRKQVQRRRHLDLALGTGPGDSYAGDQLRRPGREIPEKRGFRWEGHELICIACRLHTGTLEQQIDAEAELEGGKRNLHFANYWYSRLLREVVFDEHKSLMRSNWYKALAKAWAKTSFYPRTIPHRIRAIDHHPLLLRRPSRPQQVVESHFNTKKVLPSPTRDWRWPWSEKTSERCSQNSPPGAQTCSRRERRTQQAWR